MNDYTYKDMMRMQSEAKKRVLEMQKRSRDAATHFKSEKANNIYETVDNVTEKELPRIAKAVSYPTEITSERKKNAGEKEKHSAADIRHSLKHIFGNISNGDSEKLFIMALCLLLAEENTDDTLIMALMYLLT